jgi:cytochrome c peroxidase
VKRPAAALMLLAGTLLPAAAPDAATLGRDEVAAVLAHGPWPPPAAVDPSNRVARSARAARFGSRLFFDTRLSADGSVACASCHVPEAGWAERRAVAVGLAPTDRNTPSVVDAVFNRWFGWAGSTDSLWAASLRPLADARELGSVERLVPARVRADPDLACGYREAFGAAPPADDERLLADLGKALAAFQATLVSARTPFDEYRDALARGDREAQARYPADALRGLRLFVGRAQCNLCHLGPRFTNGEFDRVGIPTRRPDGRHDWGRYDGVKALRASRHALTGPHNDSPAQTDLRATLHAALDPELLGAFRVPALRGVARTPPYMHDGSIATLREVIGHYSTISDEKLARATPHPHAEPGDEQPRRQEGSLLRRLDLTEREIDDLVAFLRTLDPRRSIPRPAPTASSSCPSAPADAATPRSGRQATGQRQEHRVLTASGDQR